MKNFSPKKAWRGLLKVESFRSFATFCFFVVALFIIVYFGGNSVTGGIPISIEDIIFNEKPWIFVSGMALGWWLKPEVP